MKKLVVFLLAATMLVGTGPNLVWAKKRLTLWNFGAAVPERVQFFNWVEKEFEKETGIKLETEIIHWSEAWNRLLLATASGVVPDVSMVGGTWVGHFQSTGQIMDLTPYIDKFGGSEAFTPGAWESVGYGGKVTALPWNEGCRSMIIRQDILDSVGAESPSTWKELVSVGKKIQSATDQEYSIATWMATWRATQNFTLFSYLNGARLISEDTKTALLNAQEVMDMMRFWIDLITEWKVMSPTALEWGTEEVDSAFMNGEISIIPGGRSVNAMLFYDKQAPSIAGKWAIKKPPHGPKGDFAGLELTDNYMIFKASEDKEASLTLLSFLFRKDVLLRWLKAIGMGPSTRELWEDPYFQTEHWREYQEVQKVGRFIPNIPEWGETEVILEEHLARIFSAVADGTCTDDLLKDELDTINEKVQTLINKRLE